MLGRQALDVDAVKALATIPSKDELRSRLLSVFLAPGSKLARQLKAPGQNLAAVLQAYRKSKKSKMKRRDGGQGLLHQPVLKCIEVLNV